MCDCYCEVSCGNVVVIWYVCVGVVWAGGCVNVGVRWVVSTSLSCRLNKLKFSTKRKTEWWEKKKALSRMKTIAVTLHQHPLYWALLLTTSPLKTRTHTHCTMSNFFPKNSTHHKLQKTKSIRSLNLIFEIHYFTCMRTSTPARPDSPRHPVSWGRPYSRILTSSFPILTPSHPTPTLTPPPPYTFHLWLAFSGCLPVLEVCKRRQMSLGM